MWRWSASRLTEDGTRQFKEPVHEIVKVEGTLSDEEATRKVREIFERVKGGTGGTKIILEIETPVC